MIDSNGSQTRPGAPLEGSDDDVVSPGPASIPGRSPGSSPGGSANSSSSDDLPGWSSSGLPDGGLAGDDGGAGNSVSAGDENGDLGLSQSPAADHSGGGDDEDDDGSMPVLRSPVGEQTDLDKNYLRMARAKLRERAGFYGLEEDEVRFLAASGAMFSDVFELMLETDPLRRIEHSDARARARVQYTGLMIPPRDVEAFAAEGGKTIKIDDRTMGRIGRRLSDLMTAVRASAKVLGQIGNAYAEQYAFHAELLRLVEERRQSFQIRRNAAPSYLVDFARMMESLGCRRNHLRSVDGKVVRAVRDALGLDNSGGNEEFDDAEALRLQAWLAEGDALEGPAGEPEDFDGLSRLMAQSVMDGDLEKAAEILRRLQVMDGLLDDAFGGSGEPVEAGTDAGEIVPAGGDGNVSEPIGDETISEPESVPVTVPVSGPVVVPESGPVTGKAGEPEAGLQASPVDVGVLSGGSDGPGSTGDMLGEQELSGDLPGRVERLDVPRFDFTTFGEFAPDPAEQDGVEFYGRAQGVGRVHAALSAETAFGGVINLASGTPDVIPMWAREDRRSERADGMLGMADWYRFEVPSGVYALTQMPRRLKHYVRMTDDLFPPYTELSRYAEEYGFDRSVQRQVEQFAAGRVTDHLPSLAVIRAAVNARIGEVDEDLARFWLFLLVGRHHMDRIEVMFPHGFFHGVWAPDPASVEAEAGFFRLVRLLDDGDFGDKIRNIGFPPVRGKDLMPGEIDGGIA